MKHTIICLLLFIASACTANATYHTSELSTLNSQHPSPLITHTWKETPLSEVLHTIAQQSGDYHIHCIYDQLDQLRISAKVANLTIPEAVEKVCKGQPVKVKQRGQDIFVQYRKSMENKKIVLAGRVFDRLTHNQLIGATVILMNRDSAVVAQAIAHSVFQEGERRWEKAEFSMAVPKVEEHYILAVSFVGYETAYMNYTVNNLRKSEIVRNLPDIYLKQESHVLKNVNVVASKVTFYNRGDTLVYNADAFQLAEGSMLDALIKQLPGAELKDGQIFLNGKFVENLLLNGKNFFRGNNQLMLENLPSYTVKQIKVYDRLGDKSQFLGQEQPGDKTFVMDVQLKKQYRIGMLANLEAGVGNHDRYLARLFGLRFSDHSRLALYATMNNLNDSRKPGENDNWTPSDLKSGLMAMKQAGLDYNVEERDGRWKADGNVQFVSTDVDNLMNMNQTNFLASGNTVDRWANSCRNKSWKLSTDNKLYADFGSFDVEVNPVFSHQKYDYRNDFAGTTSIASADNSGLLNRQWQQGKLQGHETNLTLEARSDIKIDNEHHIELKASATHTNKDDDRFNRKQVNYAASPQHPSPDIAIDQHFRNHPDRTTTLYAEARIARLLSPSTQGYLEYTYEHKTRHQDHALYLLDLERLTPPLTTESAQTLDAQNSFNFQANDNRHSLRPMLFWHPMIAGKAASIGIFAKENIHTQRMHYLRGDLDTTLTRRTVYFESPYNYFEWTDSKKLSAWFLYSVEVTAPSLTNFVDIRDATDPMNIHLGNPDLKNIGHHFMTAFFRINDKEKQTMHSFGFYWQFMQNDLAQGYDYDPTTGVRTWQPHSVNGNWNTFLRYSFYLPLDKQRRLQLQSRTQPSYTHSVNIVDGSRQCIHRTFFTEDLSLNYKLGKHNLNLNGSVQLQHTDSHLKGFQSFSSQNYSCGMNVLIALPMKMQLSTDFKAYMRRGYTLSEMNGTDLVWNARLTCPLSKGRLLLMIDGYDLLGQLSNVTRTISAQYNAEQTTNTLPRYFLFHAVWRLNKF